MGGYFKVWRKIEDSKSWSRGALYRGLMITLLQKANWKQGYFHGQEILPGALAFRASLPVPGLRWRASLTCRGIR